MDGKIFPYQASEGICNVTRPRPGSAELAEPDGRDDANLMK